MCTVKRRAIWLCAPPALPADDFFSHLRSARNLAHATVRAYQADIKPFLECATSPAHGWNENCG
jgi:site-specific recombinase XerD